MNATDATKTPETKSFHERVRAPLEESVATGPEVVKELLGSKARSNDKACERVVARNWEEFDAGWVGTKSSNYDSGRSQTQSSKDRTEETSRSTCQ